MWLEGTFPTRVGTPNPNIDHHAAIDLVVQCVAPPGGSAPSVSATTAATTASPIISNDSDLRLPIRESRLRVPVGVVNPSSGQLAGDLRGEASHGAGGHWWYHLKRADFLACQLPDPVGTLAKPTDW